MRSYHQIGMLPLLIALLLLPGCASIGQDTAIEASDAGSVQGEAESDDRQETGNGDPWEPLNRKTFAFNEGLDRWILEPVAEAWDFVMPELVQTGVSNVFANLSTPVHLTNDLLQAKPLEAYETLWRGVVNSTVGIAGVFDVATMWEIHESDEDFGQTLGYWGVPGGPYLVLPLLGPSNPRDTLGLVGDSAAHPVRWFVPFYVSAPAAAVDIVNRRAAALESVRAERASAFDFYVFVRSAYVQFRDNRIHDRPEDEEKEAADDDLYYYDDEE